MNTRSSNEIRKICLTALFTILSLILSRVSVYLPFFGSPLVRLGLGTVTIILGSLLLGPFYGGVIGGLSDLVGALAFPVGPYFIGFTIDSILIGVLPWCVMHISRKGRRASLILSAMLFLSTISILFGFLALFDSIKIYGNTYRLDFIAKIIIAAIYTLIFGTIYLLLHYFNIKNRESSRAFTFILNSVLVDELLVTALIAGLWKYLLYDVPYFFNVGISVILLLVNLPIKTILIYAIYRAVQPIYIKQIRTINKLK